MKPNTPTPPVSRDELIRDAKVKLHNLLYHEGVHTSFSVDKAISEFVRQALRDYGDKLVAEIVPGEKEVESKLESFKEVRQKEIEEYGKSTFDGKVGFNQAIDQIHTNYKKTSPPPRGTMNSL